MGITDVLSWLLVGLLAGGLASALTPGRTAGGLLGVMGIGVLGALLGGWAWALLFWQRPDDVARLRDRRRPGRHGHAAPAAPPRSPALPHLTEWGQSHAEPWYRDRERA